MRDLEASRAIAEVSISVRASEIGVLREYLSDGDLESLGAEAAIETAIAAVCGGVCFRTSLSEETGEEYSVEGGGGEGLVEALEEGLGMCVCVGGLVARLRNEPARVGGLTGVDGREVMAANDLGEVDGAKFEAGRLVAIAVSVRAGHGIDEVALQEEGGVGGNSHVGREKLAIGLIRIGSDLGK